MSNVLGVTAAGGVQRPNGPDLRSSDAGSAGNGMKLSFACDNISGSGELAGRPSSVRRISQHDRAIATMYITAGSSVPLYHHIQPRAVFTSN